MLRGRRRLAAAVTAVVCVLLAAAAAAFQITQPPGEVVNTDVPFVEPTETLQAVPTPTSKKPHGKGRRRTADPFVWPVYGYTNEHRRAFKPGRSLRGPYRRVWRRRAPALLEFPPVISRGRLFQLADNGQLKALGLRRGHRKWKRDLGHLAASSPAVDPERGLLYVTLLEGRRGSGRGKVVAVRMRNGRVKWTRPLGSRTETSPILARDRVYVGSEDGTVLCLWARTGRVAWTYKASGAVKGSLALSDGVLFFGDYGGVVHAVRAEDGRAKWTAPVARRRLSGGRFYASAAVAYGRVYIGATDGREYSLSTEDGALGWAQPTGGYVYASAAVDDVPGLGPTIFVGSYDGVFYAMDARTGRPRWKFRSGGKISGSATVIGDVVYFSDLGRSMTYGLDTRTGRRVMRLFQGGYDPVVSDGRRLYFTGRRTLTALVPARLAAGEPTVLATRRAKAAVARRRAAERRAKAVAGKRRAAARRAGTSVETAAKRIARAARRAAGRDEGNAVESAATRLARAARRVAARRKARVQAQQRRAAKRRAAAAKRRARARERRR